MNLFLPRTWQASLFVALVAFIVYQFTISPSVDFIDAGELATVCSTLGIAHPTGYPLFTLVGWFFSKLPIASTVIMRLNLMAAFFTAIGAGAMVMLSYEILSHWLERRPAKTTQKDPKRRSPRPVDVTAFLPSISDPAVLTCAIGAGLIAAFSSTWWSQSTGIEVYPLHLAFIPSVLLCFLRMIRREAGEVVGRDGYLFAGLLGLSFANHLTTVLIAPATLYLFFARYGFNGVAWKRMGKLALPFLAAIAVYLYLPLRSASFPLMDWGHPATPGLFLKHVTGGQYKIWMFASAGAAAKNWSYFWHRLPKEFAWIGIVPLVAGIYQMSRARPREGANILIFSLLLIFGCLFYSINYDIHDIDSYFLLAYLTGAIWIAAGCYFASHRLNMERKLIIVAIGLAIICCCELVRNYEEVDESGNYMVEDYTKNLLRNLPANAIIFSTQWDFWVSGAFYYQNIEKYRPDILVIDKAMLRDRPWYYEHLKQRAPAVMAKAEPEMSDFLTYLRAFDAGTPFDEAAIAPAYQRFTQALVSRNLDHPIYITQEMIDERDELFAPGMKILPAGVAYRLLSTEMSLSTATPKLEWRDAHYRKHDYYTDNARLLQAWPLMTYARTALSHGDSAGAKQFLDAALRFKPDMNADLSQLTEREQGMAESTEQKFSQIEALRQQLR